jgi:hypothetical protein
MVYRTMDLVSSVTVGPGYSDVPDAVLGFQMTKAYPNCLRFEYSAYFYAPTIPVIFLRLVFDDIPDLLVPREVYFQPNMPGGALARHHAWTFIIPFETGLDAGGHNVKVQWRAPLGGTVSIHKQILIAYPNP